MTLGPTLERSLRGEPQHVTPLRIPADKPAIIGETATYFSERRTPVSIEGDRIVVGHAHEALGARILEFEHRNRFYLAVFPEKPVYRN